MRIFDSVMVRLLCALICSLALCVSGQTATAKNRALPAALMLMPLGDSITFGFDGTNAGYRGPLYTLLAPVAPGIRFVGSSTEGVVKTTVNPLPAEQSHNEGHGSYAIQDLDRNLDGFDNTLFKLYGGADRDPRGGHWLTGIDGRPAVYPDIITLMVGTNDLHAGPTAPDYDSSTVKTRLHALLGKLTTLRPEAKIFLAQIIPSKRRPHVEEYNRVVAAEVEDFRGAGKPVYLVDLNTGFPANGLSRDGVHPNDIGFAWMAQKWSEAIVEVCGEPVASKP